MAKHIQTNDGLSVEGTRRILGGKQLPKIRETEDKALRHLVGLDQDRKTEPVNKKESDFNNRGFLDQNGDNKTQPGKEIR